MNTASDQQGRTGTTGHFLHPGAVVCAERGDRLDTLLGSCIAAILTDERRTVATMCHFVYSGLKKVGLMQRTASAPVAIDAMYALLRRRGMSPTHCHAYVYGGGNMFPSLAVGTHVGANNVTYVLDRLQRDRVRILDHDLGGSSYRRIRWTVGHTAPEVTAVEIVET